MYIWYTGVQCVIVILVAYVLLPSDILLICSFCLFLPRKKGVCSALLFSSIKLVPNVNMGVDPAPCKALANKKMNRYFDTDDDVTCDAVHSDVPLVA